jgi:hypothetical protein
MVSGSLQYSARVGALKRDLSEPAGHICNCCIERRPFHITFTSDVSLNASLHMSMRSVSGHYQETLLTVEGVVIGELDYRQVRLKTTKLVHPLYIFIRIHQDNNKKNNKKGTLFLYAKKNTYLRVGDRTSVNTIIDSTRGQKVEHAPSFRSLCVGDVFVMFATTPDKK